MEAQLQPPYSHDHHRGQEDPHSAGVHSVVEGEGKHEHEHHGEKKSVLKRVKDKAKKIKQTITKHGHEHEHEHEQGGHDYRHDLILEEEDDEDVEIERDPEVHGAPMYESSVITGTNLPKQTDLITKKPISTLEKRNNNLNNPNVKSPTAGDGVNRPSALAMAAEYGKPPAEFLRPEPEIPFQGGLGKTQAGTAMEARCFEREIPNVKIPTTAGDDGVNRPCVPAMTAEYGRPPAEFHRSEPEIPLQGSLGKTQAGPAMEARRFEREIPLEGDLGKRRTEESNVKIGPLEGCLEEDRHAPKSTPQGIPPSNYQYKVVDPTGHGGEEVDVSPLVQRFDNMNVRDESKQVYTGSHGQFATQGTPTAEEFKPGSNLGGKLTETASERSEAKQPHTMPADAKEGTISSAMYTIADKAAAAKNMVASKLGYGEQGSSNQPASESATVPADAKAGTISSAANLITDKAAAAKNLVASKLGYGDQGDQGQGSLTQSTAESATKYGQTDKGVSLKEYLAEKLRPGDEDKALSNVITEALHKKNEAADEPPMGRVLESEEVARRLGTRQENKREGEDAKAAGSESSGAGVVDRLKDAVGMWLGKSTGMETAKDSIGQSYVNVDSSPGSHQERRLQESGN